MAWMEVTVPVAPIEIYKTGFTIGGSLNISACLLSATVVTGKKHSWFTKFGWHESWRLL